MTTVLSQVLLDMEGKIVYQSDTLFLLDGFNLDSDGQLRFINRLRKILIDMILQETSQEKIWGFKSGECGAGASSQLLLIAQSVREPLIQLLQYDVCCMLTCSILLVEVSNSWITGLTGYPRRSRRNSLPVISSKRKQQIVFKFQDSPHCKISFLSENCG